MKFAFWKRGSDLEGRCDSHSQDSITNQAEIQIPRGMISKYYPFLTDYFKKHGFDIPYMEAHNAFLKAYNLR